MSVVPRLRSNLVERLPQQLPEGWSMTVLCLSGREDHDVAVAPPAAVTVRRLSVAGVLRELLSRPPDCLEVPEPLWFRFLPLTVAAIVAARTGARLRRRKRPLVGAFVMENLAPDVTLRSSRLGAPRRLQGPLDRALRVALARALRLVDAVFWCTAAAREAYEELGPAVERWTGLGEQELMAACSCVQASVTAKQKVVLLCSELAERKGVSVLLASWPGARVVGWRLVIVGWGELLPEVAAWASGQPDVELRIGLSRAAVHAAYREATVVVLPSTRQPYWREQVGYPVLEGLAHGCLVVSSDETGAAAWLSEHGHVVVRAADVAALTDGLTTAVFAPADRPRTVLPAQDSRQRFERALMHLRQEASTSS